MPVKGKICGIADAPDALTTAEAGTDAVGFVFYQGSPRFVTPAAVVAIVREIPQFVMRVGLFVNAPEDEVVRAISECNLNLLKFHGDEPPDYCLQFGLMSMKAFRVKDAAKVKAFVQEAKGVEGS